MKYRAGVFLILLFSLCAHSQKNTIWKDRICRQKGFVGKDSILFCHLFDSLNKEFGITFIVRFKNNKNRYIPFFGSGITIKDTCCVYSSWLEELAHAVQFSERKNFYKMITFRDVGVTVWRTLFQNKQYRHHSKQRVSFGDVYNVLYTEPRSFEYEAHEIIEPTLYFYLRERMKYHSP